VLKDIKLNQLKCRDEWCWLLFKIFTKEYQHLFVLVQKYFNITVVCWRITCKTYVFALWIKITLKQWVENGHSKATWQGPALGNLLSSWNCEPEKCGYVETTTAVGIICLVRFTNSTEHGGWCHDVHKKQSFRKLLTWTSWW